MFIDTTRVDNGGNEGNIDNVVNDTVAPSTDSASHVGSVCFKDLEKNRQQTNDCWQMDNHMIQNIKTFIQAMSEWYNSIPSRDTQMLSVPVNEVEKGIRITYYSGNGLRGKGCNQTNTIITNVGDNMLSGVPSVKRKYDLQILMESLKGHADESLLKVIVKQKSKILELKSQNTTMDVPAVILTQLNNMVIALENKEKANIDLKIRNKELTAEVTDIKRSKKALLDENNEFRKTVQSGSDKIKAQCAEIQEMSDTISTLTNDAKVREHILNEQLSNTVDITGVKERLEAKEAEIKQIKKELQKLKEENQSLINKVDIVEAAAGDIIGESEVKVMLTNPIVEENKDMVAKLSKIEKRHESVVKECSILKDKIKEAEVKFNRLDGFYNDLIKTKDATINTFLEITKDQGLMETNFKRLLACYKAERELESMRTLRRNLMEDEQINDNSVEMDKDEREYDKESDEQENNNKRESNEHNNQDGYRSYDKKLLAYVRDNSNRQQEKDQTRGETRESKKKNCWFGTKCFRGSCDFEHTHEISAPMCRFRLKCKREDCLYKHSNDCVNKFTCMNPSCKNRHANNSERNENNNVNMIEVNNFEERSVCYERRCDPSGADPGNHNQQFLRPNGSFNVNGNGHDANRNDFTDYSNTDKSKYQGRSRINDSPFVNHMEQVQNRQPGIFVGIEEKGNNSIPRQYATSAAPPTWYNTSGTINNRVYHMHPNNISQSCTSNGLFYQQFDETDAKNIPSRRV